jgi:hypothetical protein
MPRAENRKRPPNSLGNVPGGRLRNKSEEVQHGVEHQRVQNKKQELLDKMRKLQESNKTDANAKE